MAQKNPMSKYIQQLAGIETLFEEAQEQEQNGKEITILFYKDLECNMRELQNKIAKHILELKNKDE